MGATQPARSGLADGLTLAAIARELAAAVVGGRVQSVVQPDRLTIAFELYGRELGRTTLTLSADPHREGVRFEAAKARRGGGQPSPLTLAAAAHLVGTRITAVEQPAWERILHFTFQANPTQVGTETAPAAWTLVAELMGRLANLILVDSGGVIRACARQVSAEMSRARTVVPGARYSPPPSQSRVPAERVTEADMAAWLREATEAPEPAWRAVVRHVAGASPLSSREAVYRALEAVTDGAPRGADADPGDVAAAALTEAIRGLFDTTATCPWLAFDGDRPIAYAAYELRHLGGTRAPSVLAAIARFEDGGAERDAYVGARESVEREITAALGRLERRRSAIEHAADQSGEAADLRLRADLVLAYQHLARRGQREIVVPSDQDEPLAISLDPTLTPVANAEAYYRRARRAERAAAGRASRLAQVTAEIQYLEQLAYDLEQATNRPLIDSVSAALAESGVAKPGGPKPGGPKSGGPRSDGPKSGGPKSSGPKSGGPKSGGPKSGGSAGEPLRLVAADGFTVWVGRNARQNERVTFEKAARGDLWLHARDVPGAHVVVKAAGREVPEATILEAASAAAWYSRARGESSVVVWVVDARRVRRLSGGRPGMVTFDEGRTVVVEPAALSSEPGPLDEGEHR